MNQAAVLGQPIPHQPALHHADKVYVEKTIYDHVDHFLASIPRIVNTYISVRNLQARGYPDAIDRDVDERDEYRDAHFEPPHELLIDCYDAAAVDDDLEQEMDLQCPERDYRQY